MEEVLTGQSQELLVNILANMHVSQVVFKPGVTQVNTQTYVSAINSYYFQAVVYCLEFDQVENKPTGKYNFSKNNVRNKLKSLLFECCFIK